MCQVLSTWCCCQSTMFTLKYCTSLPLHPSWRFVRILLACLTLKWTFNLQDGCNFFLLSNELKPLSLTGTSILLPYLPGHDYVLLKGPGNGVHRSSYCETQPSILSTFKYSIEIENPEVLHSIEIKTVSNPVFRLISQVTLRTYTYTNLLAAPLKLLICLLSLLTWLMR